MSTAITQIGNEIDKLQHKLNAKYHAEFVKLYKIAQKYKKPNIKLKELLSKSKVFTEQKELFLNTIDKKIIRTMEAHFRAIEAKTGISVGRVAFYADYKTINQVFINNLDQQTIDAINQNMAATLFDTKQVNFNTVAASIGKSVNKTIGLFEEAINTTTRHITNNTYKKIEKSLEKEAKVYYKYIGPFDAKISAICNSFYNKVLTRKEWEKLKHDIFVKGGHFKCRHSLEIAKLKEIK